jgi:large subunit ribosomal protein L15
VSKKGKVMRINELKDNPGSRKKRRLVGRGIGSGLGKTSGRGGKGQTARSGVALAGFEGGQTPLYKRLPQRGFKNLFRVVNQIINLGDLQEFIAAKKLDDKNLITCDMLLDLGIIQNTSSPVKLLAKGTLEKAINIEVHSASAQAIECIRALGGEVKFIGALAA